MHLTLNALVRRFVTACWPSARALATVIATRAFCAHVPDDSEFEPTCLNEFWSLNRPILARIEAEAVDDPFADLVAWLRQLESAHGPFGRRHKATCHFKFASDNPAYDLGFINLELARRGIELPLQEMFSDYVPCDDPTQVLFGMTAAERATVAASVTAPHDHWPVNDATKTFQQMCAVSLALQQRRVRTN